MKTKLTTVVCAIVAATSSAAAAATPGDALAIVMNPYTSNSDDLAAQQADELLRTTDLFRSSFEQSDYDAFFRKQLAHYVSEIVVSTEYDAIGAWHAMGETCHAVIDQFGELTSDAEPFATHEDSPPSG